MDEWGEGRLTAEIGDAMGGGSPTLQGVQPA